MTGIKTLFVNLLASLRHHTDGIHLSSTLHDVIRMALMASSIAILLEHGIILETTLFTIKPNDKKLFHFHATKLGLAPAIRGVIVTSLLLLDYIYTDLIAA